MYQLYNHPYSQHSRRVIALLKIAGIEYENKNVALETGEHMSAEYLAINPNHQVPTLIDNDVKIHESNAILRYLCIKHCLKDWYPADLAAWATVEQWLDWGQCRLSQPVIDIVFNTVFAGDNGDAEAIKRGHDKLAELIPILSNGLKNHDFLAGSKPTIADLAIGCNISHLCFADAAPHDPIIEKWMERLSSIDGFRETVPKQMAA